MKWEKSINDSDQLILYFNRWFRYKLLLPVFRMNTSHLPCESVDWKDITGWKKGSFPGLGLSKHPEDAEESIVFPGGA